VETEFGLASQRAGNIDDAVKAFDKAIELRPDDPDAYNNLGLAYLQKGDAEGAIPKFKRALQLRPNDSDLYGNLAVAYLQVADFDAAATHLQLGLKITPDNASLHYNLGLVYKLKDQLDKAVPELERAIRLQPMRITHSEFCTGNEDNSIKRPRNYRRRSRPSQNTPKPITRWGRFTSSRTSCPRLPRNCGKRSGCNLILRERISRLRECCGRWAIPPARRNKQKKEHKS
jgi:tetratricopeptide (TPR) repeat protein